MPIASGSTVSIMRLISMFVADMVICWPSLKKTRRARSIRNGIVNTVITLVIADNVTQRGTSAREANE